MRNLSIKLIKNLTRQIYFIYLNGVILSIIWIEIKFLISFGLLNVLKFKTQMFKNDLNQYLNKSCLILYVNKKINILRFDENLMASKNFLNLKIFFNLVQNWFCQLMVINKNISTTFFNTERHNFSGDEDVINFVFQTNHFKTGQKL
ncbi:hypothetical protein BpHYR1_041979 [Brachionus plicatilis]|uniref:Transmembrane protein n=1 Tax=Brachionus plicatilis TaxID=10195 RepID=A0A3M7R4D9_BRAPC|nr:hypothetical protein BpHYR1_041979 [Brachionus plicatilis]